MIGNGYWTTGGLGMRIAIVFVLTVIALNLAVLAWMAVLNLRDGNRKWHAADQAEEAAR